MSDYLTVAEVYQMQHRLIDIFGGLHGVRAKNAVEAAVFRPQTGYYNSYEEEAAALMESLGNNTASSTATSASPSPLPTSSCGATASASKLQALRDMNSSMDRWSATNFALPESSRGFASTASHSTSRII